jgi:hypothetical protein
MTLLSVCVSSNFFVSYAVRVVSNGSRLSVFPRTTPRVMSTVGLGAKNDCAGEGQQQFTRPTRTSCRSLKKNA